jgi:quaternary ammonium compound-resistance protein SugE
LLAGVYWKTSEFRMMLLLLLFASALYAVGGLFMKLSRGMSELWPTLAFLTLFVGGAMAQAMGMRRTEFGVSYVAVLGTEAVLATVLSATYLHERYSPSRIAAIALVLVGILWLRRS